MERTTEFEPSLALIHAHMPIVHRVVAQLVRRLPRSVPREDLVAAGTLGLYQALKKGPPESPAMFAAYASIRVRGAIVDELRRLDWFPRRRREAARAASSEDAGSRAETEAGNLDRNARSGRDRALVWLDELEATSPLASGDGTPGDHVEDKEALLALRRAIEDLPERERAVIEMRYFRGMTGKEVAFSLGLSEARVSQLHARAVALLRHDIEGEGALQLAA